MKRVFSLITPVHVNSLKGEIRLIKTEKWVYTSKKMLQYKDCLVNVV